MEASKTPRLIAVDMDGTLLGPDGRVSERNLRALRRAHELGVEVVIATGRRHGYAMGPLREHNLCAENALISSNGTVIRTLGAKLLHHTRLPVETARWIVDHCDAFRSSMVLTFDTVQPDGNDTRGALVCEQAHDLRDNIGRWMDANGKFIEYVDRLEDALDGDAPIQMMLCGTCAQMQQAIDRLLESDRVAGHGRSGSARPETALTEVVLHRTEYPERDLLILDLLPAGCSKASALEYLASARGLTPADVMAIGDNWNDVPMLEWAGRSVVMANAPADLLGMAAKRGWTVAPSHHQDGAAWAMEQALDATETEAPDAASETATMVV